MDTFFSGQSQYNSRLNVVIRLTAYWDLGELGRDHDTD
jgi:hypothetical protein